MPGYVQTIGKWAYRVLFWGGVVVTVLWGMFADLPLTWRVPVAVLMALGVVSACHLLLSAVIRADRWIAHRRELKNAADFPFEVAAWDLVVTEHDVQLWMQLLSRRRDGRVVVVPSLCWTTPDAKRHWKSEFELEGGLSLELGPEEFSEGMLRFKAEGREPLLGERYALVVRDIVTGRMSPLLVLPGCYPKTSLLRSRKRPSFALYAKGEQIGPNKGIFKVPPPIEVQRDK